MAEHKLILVDLFMDEETDMVIVLETWAVDDDEIYYPTHEVKGAKLQKCCRLHMQPDPTTWRRYPFRLIRMCGNIPLSFFKFLSCDEFSIRCNLFCFYHRELG